MPHTQPQHDLTSLVTLVIVVTFLKLSAFTRQQTIMAPKSEAASLLQKAEKKASSSTGWFGSSKSKYEEAGDLFQSAANRFKLENSFVEAGDAFSKEAECREKSDFEYDAANAWWNASKAYKQAGRPDRAFVSHSP